MNSLLAILNTMPKPLFGQQRAYSSGQYPQPWQATEGAYSDIGAITGQAPAIYGFPLNAILKNKNKITLEQTLDHLTELTKTGVVIEFDWHMAHPAGRGYKSDPTVPDKTIASILPGGAYHEDFKKELDYLATFFNRLRDDGVYGLFRPFHEMNGDWFWWGYGLKMPNTPGVSLVEWSVISSGLNGADARDFVGEVLPKGRVYFLAGEASKVINVTVQGDADLEPDEFVTVGLVNPKTGHLVKGATAQGMIQNDD